MKHQNKIIDPFLQKVLLSRRNDPNARGIMESIQEEQNRIINEDFSHDIVVQGCAGSGKTVVLFHRLANMEYTIKNFDINDAIMLAPNNNFRDYISSFVKSLDIRNIKIVTYSELINSVAEFSTTDELLKEINESNAAEELIHVLIKNNQDLEVIKLQQKKAFREIYLKEFIRKRNLANRKDYATFKKYEKKDIVKDYDTLLESSLRDLDAAKAIENDIKKNNRKIDQLKKQIINRKQYKYIFIDEGQDYSARQYELLKALYPKASFNIFGDIKQQLAPQGINGWFDLTTIFETIHEYRLKENYRNSCEIVDYVSEKLGPHYEMVNMGPSVADVEEFSFDKVKHYLEYEFDIMGNEKVAFVVDEIIKSGLTITGDDADEIINKVDIYLADEIKGMEYDAVFVILSNKATDNERYVAYTRAINALYVVKL